MPKDFYVFVGHKDEDTLENILSLLAPHYTVCGSSNGGDILNNIIDMQPDLAVFDFNIPEIDVFELCEKIDGGYPQISTVIYVEKEKLALAKKKWKKRAIDYIVGPLGAEEFVEDVNKAVRFLISEQEYKRLLRKKIDVRFQMNSYFSKVDSMLKDAIKNKDWALVNQACEELNACQNVVKDIDAE